MRPVRILLIAVAVILVAGAVASAAPPIRGASEDEPTTEVSAAPSPEATDHAEPAVSPEPTETESPEPVAVETASSEDPTDEDATEDATAAPDFSACAGLHGLENAICRHEALLAIQPDNVGLQTSLAQLEANLAAHEERDASRSADEDGASCPGKSCEPHGNGNGHGSG
jgi:hypothetical protein